MGNDAVHAGQLRHLLGLEGFVLVAVRDINTDDAVRHAVTDMAL
ncbi:hypothetical protein [Arthrobacter sp. NPDC093139]